MTSFHIRPRFRKTIKASIEEIITDIQTHLEKSTTCQGSVSHYNASIRVKDEEQHYWSPQLGLSFEKVEEGTLIRGLYGPAPNVWVLFAFSYGALALLGLFHLMIGISMVQMGKNPWILWSICTEGILALILYIAAQMGQKKGAEQLYRLHFFFEEVVHEKLVIE